MEQSRKAVDPVPPRAVELALHGSREDQVLFSHNGFNLLTTLVLAGRLDVADTLLAGGFPVDANNPGYVSTALTEAASFGLEDAIRLLLAHGATIEGHENEDLPPLLAAARRGQLTAARLLLENGADVHARGIHDLTWRDIAKDPAIRTLLEEYERR